MAVRIRQNEQPIPHVATFSLAAKKQLYLSDTGLNWSVRLKLYSAGIRFVGDLEGKNLCNIMGLGRRSIALINCALASIGLMLSRTNGGALVNINEQHDDKGAE